MVYSMEIENNPLHLPILKKSHSNNKNWKKTDFRQNFAKYNPNNF